MFDFTKEVILNDLSTVSATAGTSLDIKYVNKYLKTSVAKVYRRTGHAATKAVATVALPASGNLAGVYRLNLSVSASGAAPIDYDRWAITKGKPFYVEVNVTAVSTGAQLATLLAAGISRGLKKYNGQDIKDFTVTASGANLVINGTYGFQHLAPIIELYDNPSEDFLTVAVGTTTTPGVAAFLDSWYILSNLRLPTQEATRYLGEDQDERPISGAFYNQYSFEYQIDRNFTGQGAVGQMIKSKTTHVFFVPQTISAAFEASITSAFGNGSIVEAQGGAVVNAGV